MVHIASTITEDLILKSIVNAVQSVCDTMLKLKANYVVKTDAPSNTDFASQTHVFGCVGFVGKINGMVYLCLNDEFAVNAAVNMLGMSVAEVTAEGDAVIKDVIGELTNMTVGCFKNALCDKGYTCKLTLPTIVRGQNLAVNSMTSSVRHVYHFECTGHRILADIQIKIE